MRYVICRSKEAAVFAGEFISRNGREVVLHNARRIWYWDGAATLSQLAVDGTTSPKTCKFPVVVPHVELLEVCEILDCTEKARASIEAVPTWAR